MILKVRILYLYCERTIHVYCILLYYDCSLFAFVLVPNLGSIESRKEAYSYSSFSFDYEILSVGKKIYVFCCNGESLKHYSRYCVNAYDLNINDTPSLKGADM